MSNSRDHLIIGIFNKVIFIVFLCLVTTLVICSHYSNEDFLILGYFIFLSGIAFVLSSGCQKCGRRPTIDFYLKFFNSWVTPCPYCDDEENLQLTSAAWQIQFAEYVITNCKKMILLVMCMIITVLIALHLFFPDIYWFYKIWLGCVTAVFLSIVVIFIFRRRLITTPQNPRLFNKEFKRKCYFAGAVFLGVFCFGMTALPGFIQIEQELNKVRSISSKKISGVSLKDKNYTSAAKISLLKKSCSQAKLFHPNHELAGAEFNFIIAMDNGETMSYTACIYKNHMKDIVLLYPTYHSEKKILLPGAADLLAPETSKNKSDNKPTGGNIGLWNNTFR